MDNCLASNSETGGVGCDNMTMVVIALLRGKSKEDWYKEIGDRVANGDGPCAPPEYGMCHREDFPFQFMLKLKSIAEFRGPGVRHNIGDSEDDYDLDMEKRTGGIGGRSGRIILLGDGTEVLTDSDETEMFDHEEEDKDLNSQVSKGGINPMDEGRGAREETPGPEPQNSTETPRTDTSVHPDAAIASEKATSTDTTSPTSNPIPESAIPEKLHTPATSETK